MMKVLLHRQPDGLVEVVRVGRLRHTAVGLAVAVLGLPAALMVLLAAVALLPVLTLAIPSVPLVGVYILLMRLWNHDAAGNGPRVIHLHRGVPAVRRVASEGEGPRPSNAGRPTPALAPLSRALYRFWRTHARRAAPEVGRASCTVGARVLGRSSGRAGSRSCSTTSSWTRSTRRTWTSGRLPR